MDEFKFVVKCLLFTGFIMFISQYKLNNETLEAKAEYALIHSSTAGKLREVAAGGVKFIRTSIEDGYGFVKNKMAHDGGGNRQEPSINYLD